MVNPLVVGLQAIRLVGDVLDIQAQAVEELAFKKLPGEKYDECGWKLRKKRSEALQSDTKRQPVIIIRGQSKFTLGIIAVR